MIVRHLSKVPERGIQHPCRLFFATGVTAKRLPGKCLPSGVRCVMAEMKQRKDINKFAFSGELHYLCIAIGSCD
jgi:hypothetical protein